MKKQLGLKNRLVSTQTIANKMMFTPPPPLGQTL